MTGLDDTGIVMGSVAKDEADEAEAAAEALLQAADAGLADRTQLAAWARETRKLSDEGRAAIADLFERSFGAAPR